MYVGVGGKNKAQRDSLIVNPKGLRVGVGAGVFTQSHPLVHASSAAQPHDTDAVALLQMPRTP